MIPRITILFGLVLIAGATSAEPLVDGDPQAGAQKAAACAACHGPNGNSSSPQWPSLAGQHARYLLRQLQLFKSGQRDNAIMLGLTAGLSEQDMQDLAVYFARQTAQPGTADETLVEAGQALYFGGKPEAQVPACSGCHGPTGLGDAAAGFPRLSGQQTEYVAARLRAYRDGGAPDTAQASIMTGAAAGLGEADIRAVASFVSGLRPQRTDEE
jgi:cytochrome c553